MANSLDQGCTSISNVANSPLSPLPPKFLSLMKFIGRAKFEAELFKSKIDLLASQYSQGFDAILRQGANETRDEVIRDITCEIDMEVSSHIAKLEDFKDKLKNGPVDQDQSNDGPLQGDSPVGIQAFRECMVKLQQQIRDTAGSNTAFQKRFKDASARKEERSLEITAMKKELAEALESICELKDDMNQIPVRPVVATANESVQTNVEDFHAMCAPLVAFEKDYEKFIKWFEEHRDTLFSVKEEFLEKMRVLNAKLEVCEQACTSADINLGRALGIQSTVLSFLSVKVQFASLGLSTAHR